MEHALKTAGFLPPKRENRFKWRSIAAARAAQKHGVLLRKNPGFRAKSPQTKKNALTRKVQFGFLAERRSAQNAEIPPLLALIAQRGGCLSMSHIGESLKNGR